MTPPTMAGVFEAGFEEPVEGVSVGVLEGVSVGVFGSEEVEVEEGSDADSVEPAVVAGIVKDAVGVGGGGSTVETEVVSGSVGFGGLGPTKTA